MIKSFAKAQHTSAKIQELIKDEFENKKYDITRENI